MKSQKLVLILCLSLLLFFTLPGLQVPNRSFPTLSSGPSSFLRLLPDLLPFISYPASFTFPSSAYGQDDYIVGPEDEISIAVWDHPDLTRKIRVNLEGNISFPLIGEVQVGGLTAIAIEKKLKDLLDKDYVINPQVSVIVETFKSAKVSIMGEVKTPGTYALTRRLTVVEALSLAGGLLSEADDEIMIVRPKKSGHASGPLLPEEVEQSEIIRVQIRDVLQRDAIKGERVRNIEVRNGDTIFVPKARMFYVTGEVTKPGQFAYQKGMSLLHAISTAGGFTERANRRKVKVVREVQGKKVELSISMDQPIEPGDTVVVPESFW